MFDNFFEVVRHKIESLPVLIGFWEFKLRFKTEENCFVSMLSNLMYGIDICVCSGLSLRDLRELSLEEQLFLRWR